MRDAIRVLLLGTGQMGSGIGRLILEKQGFELVAGCGRRRQRVGLDLGRAIGLDRDLGIALGCDLQSEIARTRPDVAIQTTCSRLADAMGEIVTLVRNRVHVISIAEEMAYPAATSAAAAAEIDRLAIEHGVGVVGTGVNPGFVLDLLVIVLSGVCSEIRSIVATRVNDLSPYGPSVLATQGVGLTVDAFYRDVKAGTVAGHLGFPQSIRMIGDTLGWEIERVEENRKPIVSTVRRATPFVVVEAGHVAGCLHTAVAFRAGEAVIRLVHPQQICPEREGVSTGDTIEISGTPNIRLVGSPEIPGGLATIGIAVNMIPRALSAPPGLHCMADLPVPAATLGDARQLVRSARREAEHG